MVLVFSLTCEFYLDVIAISLNGYICCKFPMAKKVKQTSCLFSGVSSADALDRLFL